MAKSSSVTCSADCADPKLSGEPAAAAFAEGEFGGQTRTNGAGSGEKGEFGVYNRVLPDIVGA